MTSQEPNTPSETMDFTLIFDALSDSENASLIEVTVELQRQSEVLQLIADLSEQTQPTHVVTYLSN